MRDGRGEFGFRGPHGPEFDPERRIFEDRGPHGSDWERGEPRYTISKYIVLTTAKVYCTYYKFVLQIILTMKNDNVMYVVFCIFRKIFRAYCIYLSTKF